MALPDRIATVSGLALPTLAGLALTAVWLTLLAVFWLVVPGPEAAGGISRLATLIGAVLPLVLIWMAVALIGAIASLRAEADELRQRLSELRELAATRGKPPAAAALAETQRQAPSPPTQPATRNAPPSPARARPAQDIRQQAMRFDAPEPVEIATETMIRALNFPDGPDDEQAIAALRTALQDHDTSRVLRAAQDVITLLAGHDIYMDDLPPDPAPVIIWRRFAEGARGPAIAAIGGIHDPTALEVASALLHTDEIFRDAAHHFLRHFDLMLTRFLSRLDDTQVEILADTRAARAFMLVGRAAHGFG